MVWPHHPHGEMCPVGGQAEARLGGQRGPGHRAYEARSHPTGSLRGPCAGGLRASPEGRGADGAMGGAASTRLGAPAAALSTSGNGNQDPPSPLAGRRGLPSPRRRLGKDTRLPRQLQGAISSLPDKENAS